MQAFRKKDIISIVGCGWYGLELAKTLINLGYSVKGSTTHPEKLAILAEDHIKPYLLSFQSGQPFVPSDFFHTDILIICIPPMRASDQVERYTEKIADISRLAEINRVKKVLFISATSVYGDAMQEVDELSETIPETASGRQILAAENMLSDNPAFKTCILRFSGLVGPGRHPGRFFAGKKNIPNGRAPVNLIHLDDCIGITLQILKVDAFGYTFNASAPDHPQKQVFYTAAAKAAGLAAPEFVDELQEWKIISSIQITQLLNYSFKINNWESWLPLSIK